MTKVENILLAFLLALPFAMQGQTVRNCGVMQSLDRLIRQDPQTAVRMQEIEAQTAEAIHAQASQRIAATAITIPVVVHVVYNTAAQNISDAQILSQIDVLNEDFGKRNADITKVPAAFAPLAATAGITFCLAKTDPTGKATTGIIRKATTVTAFATDDKVKSATTGGDNAWNAAKYLNIWVCNISGGILGYAQFPGGPAATDGVVILYSAFGRTGTLMAPFNKGRTATHEVGHWLNLRHIWGDASCGTDYVTDTPTQSTMNYGCPTYPHKTCGNNGDMSMNYMDYTDDACMYMFSAGQSARMGALFVTGGARSGFATSTVCNAPSIVPGTCSIPAGRTSSAVTAYGATLSWAGVSGATGYGIQYRKTGTATWTALNTAATSLSLTGLAAATAYEWQIKTNCSATSASTWSASTAFTTAAATATYCASQGSSTASEWIAYYALGTIANTSAGHNSPGYQNFTSLGTSLRRGTSYVTTFRTGYAGTPRAVFYRIWIDYNRDGDFADAGEQVTGTSSIATYNLAITFTVPATAAVGSTRLRIAMKYGAAPSYCEAFANGQVEDYTVNITTTREMEVTAPTFTVYPNPAHGEARLNMAFAEEHNAVSLKLRDLQGRTLWQESLEAGDRVEGLPIPVAGLAEGLYLIQIETGGRTYTEKIKVDR